mmetsp:Transcript_74493/g.218368  ORF Transcript_74493/g.218368 Transcript_74493/m.218368 type:complete len:245 (+) Transcript_74493:1537-2271(+)
MKRVVSNSSSGFSYSTTNRVLGPEPPPGKRLHHVIRSTRLSSASVPALRKACVSHSAPKAGDSTNSSGVCAKGRPKSSPVRRWQQRSQYFCFSFTPPFGDFFIGPSRSANAGILAATSQAGSSFRGTPEGPRTTGCSGGSSSCPAGGAHAPASSSVEAGLLSVLTARSLPGIAMLIQPSAGPAPASFLKWSRPWRSSSSSTKAPVDKRSALGAEDRASASLTRMPPLSAPPTISQTCAMQERGD